MPIPDQARVKSLLQQHEPVLAGVVTRAWDRWRRNVERAELNRRSRACLMHNYMMLDAIPGLPDGERISVKERHETALFLIADELVIRFKKGDERGLSSNIGTQAALDFTYPNETLALFDLPDLCRVDVSYRLNDLETKILDVLIVARDNDKPLWSYSILEQEAGTAPLPLATEPPQPPLAETGIRLPEFQDETKKQKQGSDGTE